MSNIADVNSSQYVPTRIDDPTYFSDEGERLDFTKVEPKLSPDAEKLFNSMKANIIEHEKATEECRKKSMLYSIPFFILSLFFLKYNISYTVTTCAVAYGVIYSIVIRKDKSISSRLIKDMEEKYADICIEPIMYKLEPGADASYKLVYYPVFGYIMKDSRSYYTGCNSFGSWLYNIGILPNFNSKFKVGMSINTLNANREGFFLTNGEALSEYKVNNQTHYTTKFKGPIIAVRLQHSIDGWFSCHTTRSSGRKESDGAYKFIRDTIDVENENFNKKFNVIASTQMEAFYVLSPLVIERLLAISTKVKGMGVYIKGDFCVFAVYTDKWYFNPPSSSKEASEMSIASYYRDLAGLVNFAYSFKDAVDLNFK